MGKRTKNNNNRRKKSSPNHNTNISLSQSNNDNSHVKGVNRQPKPDLKLGAKKIDYLKILKSVPYIDIIWIGLLLFFIISSGIEAISQKSDRLLIEVITDFIPKPIFYILASATLFEVGYFFGFEFLVPRFYFHYKEKSLKRNVNKHMEAYFSNDAQFIKKYDEQRIKYFLSNIGVAKSDFDQELIPNLIRIKSYNNNTIKDICSSIMHLIKCDGVILEASKITISKPFIYPVDYYLDLFEIMYNSDYRKKFANAIVYLIQKYMLDLSSNTKIVVANNSNFLLAFEVSNIMSFSIINCSLKERITENTYWEGNLTIYDDVIFVHDVLAKGEQFVVDIERIKSNCKSIKGIFCIVNRSDLDGQSKVLEKGVKVYSLFDLNDNDICKIKAGNMANYEKFCNNACDKHK